MVWPCFVDALCELQYYFSVDEVLLICTAARVNVIVFTAQGDVFAYAGDSARDSDGNAVVPIVLDYAAETLRGHFSRLLQNDVYGEAENSNGAHIRKHVGVTCALAVNCSCNLEL